MNEKLKRYIQDLDYVEKLLEKAKSSLGGVLGVGKAPLNILASKRRLLHIFGEVVSALKSERDEGVRGALSSLSDILNAELNRLE